ncbi:ankyrin repeat domain-containing protein, partial [archaeon]
MRASVSDGMEMTGERRQQELDSALLQAARRGDGPEVHKLLNAGANIHARNQANSTPLHEAVLGGHAEVVAMLLDAGAAAELVNSAGNDALHLAVTSGHASLAHRVCNHTRCAN